MKNLAKKAAPLLICVTLILLSLPMWAASKSSDEQSIRNATAVLQAMLESKDVPHSVLAKADCVVILPSVKKFAVGVGATGGRGPMSCREGKDFGGKWSPPAMYSIGGLSAGVQLGGTATDYILLIMSSSAADKVLNGHIKVGSDATAAAGPGASAGESVGGADIFTYSRTKGLFAGVSLNGATLDQDNDANERLYGKKFSARNIVSGEIKPTSAGESLMSVLDSKAAKHM
jgi:SH3 domain-containing YSC84-like protein 1